MSRATQLRRGVGGRVSPGSRVLGHGFPEHGWKSGFRREVAGEGCAQGLKCSKKHQQKICPWGPFHPHNSPRREG